MRETCLTGSLRFHARVPRRAPHVVHVVAAGVEHRDADRLLHEHGRRVQKARQRGRVAELCGVIGRQDQRSATRHRQPDHTVTGRGDLLVGRQPRGQFLGEERLPLICIGLVVEARRRVPVGVEAGLPADGHHDGDAGVVEPLECRGVDVPPAVVVLGAQPVEEVDRLGSARAGCRRRCASGLDVGAAAPPGLDVGAAAPPGWNSTRTLRPIAVLYTSRYSTGRPSRENACAVGTPVSHGSVNSAASATSKRLSICCSYRPFHVQRRACGMC